MQFEFVILDRKSFTTQFGISTSFDFLFRNKMLNFLSYKSIFVSDLTGKMDKTSSTLSK